MTKEYIQKLINIAKGIQNEQDEHRARERIGYLIGFILALEKLNLSPSDSKEEDL